LNPTVSDIDQWLPQTQCTKCGYPRCRAYAEAIAAGDAGINRCPPGGDVTINGLAELLGVAATALDPDCGVHVERRTALIDEDRCIGCALCIDACPVDAIVGANRFLHDVVTTECTGCELCVPACPVDCIIMAPIPRRQGGAEWRWNDYSPHDTERARRRCETRLLRLSARDQESGLKHRHRLLRQPGSAILIREQIAQAVARHRRKRH